MVWKTLDTLDLPHVSWSALESTFAGDTPGVATLEPGLIRRAMLYLRSTGDILYYDHIESLRDVVFLKPQWLVDVMKAMVHHDLARQLQVLDESQLGGLDVRQVQLWGAEFLTRGILDERLLPWLWSELGPDTTDIPELLELLIDLRICVPWVVNNGYCQWLVPLRLPDARPVIPSEWAAVVSDSAQTGSFAGRQLDFGATRIPSGMVGQVVAHCTSLAGLAGHTMSWKRGTIVYSQSTGHQSFPYVMFIELTDSQTMLLSARSTVAAAHEVLLRTVCFFQAEIMSVIGTNWPGSSPTARTLFGHTVWETAGDATGQHVLQDQGPTVLECESRRLLGETEIPGPIGIAVPLMHLVDAKPLAQSPTVLVQLTQLRFYGLLSCCGLDEVKSQKVQDFKDTLDKVGEQALGGLYKRHKRSIHGGLRN